MAVLCPSLLHDGRSQAPFVLKSKFFALACSVIERFAVEAAREALDELTTCMPVVNSEELVRTLDKLLAALIPNKGAMIKQQDSHAARTSEGQCATEGIGREARVIDSQIVNKDDVGFIVLRNAG